MKRISNRPLAAFVAFALVVGLVPFNALAEEDAIPPAEEDIVEQVAEEADPEPVVVPAEEPSAQGDEAEPDKAEPADEEAAETDEVPAEDAAPEGAAPEAMPAGEEVSDPEPAAKPAPAAKSAAPKLTPQATTIDSVSITVTPPSAGAQDVDSQSVVSIPASAHYSLRSAYWVFGDSSTTIVDRYTDIEAGQKYALTIVLKAEDGYTFPDGSRYTVTGATPQDGGVLWLYDSSEAWANVLVMPAESATAEMRVWTPGHGTVTVNGSDYSTEFQGTWPEGTEVTVEAVPADGYQFARWWVAAKSGSGRLVKTVAATMTAGTDVEAEARFGLEKASVTITAPKVGTSGEGNPPAISVPSGAGYSVVETRWVGKNSTLDAMSLETPTNFEAGKTYYAYVRLEDGEDVFAAAGGGAVFDTSLDVSGGNKTVQRNWQRSDGATIEAIITVTPQGKTHTVTFDTDGLFQTPATQTVEDGAKAARPASPAADAHADGYEANGLSFRSWYTKPASEISSYWEFCYTPSSNENGCIFDFNAPVTQDTTVYAVYEGVLTIRSFNVTNNQSYAGGTFEYNNFNSLYFSEHQSIQAFCFYKMPVFLKAKPADGYTFAGWSTSASKDDIISTEAEYDYIFMKRATVYALFEKEAPAVDLTVSFTNVSMASVPLSDLVSSIVVNGEEWMLPASGMKVTGQIPAGASVTAVVKATDSAVFFGASPSTLSPELSEDMTTYTFSFTMPEAATELNVLASKAVDVNYDANGGTKGPAWPGDTIKYPEGIAGMITSWFVDYAPVDVSSGEIIVEPPAGSKYAGIEITDKNGVHTGKPGETIKGLDLSQGGTIKYLWEKVPALTLHWSSPDGEDLAEPVVIENVSGMTVDEALDGAGLDLHTEVFTKDGYLWSGRQTPAPMSNYASLADLDAAQVKDTDPVGDGLDIYYIMFKEIDAVELSVEAPVCGAENKMVDNEPTNPPDVTLPSDVHYGSAFEGQPPAIWGEWATDHVEPYEGTFTGGQSYPLLANLAADFGYYFADGLTATVAGMTGTQALLSPDSERPAFTVGVSAQVAVEHTPGEAVTENVVDAGCTKAGSHDEAVYCSGCGEELSRETVTDPALGHDWGAWKTVTEATEEADGLRVRACHRCGEVEEEVIPKLVVEYSVASGDGQTYTKTSGEALTFTFKRSVNDDMCFSHFTGVRVDGRLLSEKAYTAEAGSTVVTLNADYLETLAVGNHTLTALFDDGNGEATASFAVAEKEEPSPAPNKKGEAKPAKPARKGLPQTSDTFTLVGITALTMALVGLAMTLAGRRIRE